MGRKATINTVRDGLLTVQLIKNFEGDVERRLLRMRDDPPLPDWEDAKHVVYWVRPMDDRNARCVEIIRLLVNWVPS